MALDPEKLKKILAKGDVDAVVKFFAGASEKDRAAVAPVAVERCRFIEAHWQGQFNKKIWAEVEAKGPVTDWQNFAPAVYAAALACGDFKAIKAIGDGYGLMYLEEEPLQTILSDRRPPWVGEFVEMLAGHDLRRWGGHWKRIRALVRPGLCAAPKNDNYVLSALSSIWPRWQQGKQPPPLVDLLLNERDWLENSFWRLFEIDGTGEVSLANCDKYGKIESWSAGIVELSRRGILSRERLLDASLAALSRDFIQFRAGWFSRFHELLEPTSSERLARADTYLQLIGSSIPPTVAFAVNAIAIIDKNNPLPAKTLIANLQPALHARGKAVVKESVKLLAAAAKREPKARAEICLTAIPALLNEASDVQKAVLDLLDAHGDKNDVGLKSKLEEHSGAIAASLKPRLAPWLGKPASKPAAVPTTIAKHKPLSRIDSSREIEPINNLDDLIHLAATVLEEPANPMDIERLMDGAGRLCDQRPGDFAARTAPLRKRAMQKRGEDGPPRWLGDQPFERMLAMFILTWIDGADRFNETAEALGRVANEQGFIFRRFMIVGRSLANCRAMPLLSAPTHLAGWIKPQTLVDRWLAWQRAGIEIDLHEQVLALLRMAPEGRDKALGPAKKLTGESGAAVRFALGEDEKIGTNAALWLAACRSRQPHGDLPQFEAKHPSLGPDAGVAAQFTWTTGSEHKASGNYRWITLEFELRMTVPIPKNVNHLLLPVLFHRPADISDTNAKNLIRYAATLWPANRESFFARACKQLQISAQWADVNDRDYAAYVELLADPHTELRPIASLAFALALAAEGDALRSLAQDALIAAISEHRVAAVELGQTMSRLFQSGFNKFCRWSKSLREVSRLSPEHARTCAELLTHILKGDPQKAPRDTSALLELLYELLNETNSTLSDPATRAYISALPAGGKTAKLAKQLLALAF
ncbi:MAG TPA: DUF6493 family protein [Verrucomicrobiae bacterium]